MSAVWCSLSTTVCSVPARPEQLLQRCRQLGVDSGLGLALDVRLPPAVQRHLLDEAARHAIVVAEMALPMTDLSGRPHPSAISEDEDERRACGRLIVDAVQLAASYGVARVLLYPWALPLRLSVDSLLAAFAAGEDLPEESLRSERAGWAGVAADSLRSVLGPSLEVAASLGGRICFASPTIWPHQFPNSEEVEALQREFDGAPLDAARFSDWAHARSVFFDASGPNDGADAAWDADFFEVASSGLVLPRPAAAPREVASPGVDDSPSPRRRSPLQPLRLADACASRLRLPLGVGQSDWRSALRSPALDLVLAFDEQTTRAEVDESREAISRELVANRGESR
jgi:hypothetical protein